ncbi:SREBP regulating gene protein-like [Cebus imitator]|uniref:SREBP regulating gene protein-like n=1 Tax=Cebus imitator TaxID=2715852 RepID=UPI000809EB7A|nr:SREBP regulating gene protein-like [Cebus imitator]
MSFEEVCSLDDVDRNFRLQNGLSATSSAFTKLRLTHVDGESGGRGIAPMSVEEVSAHPGPRAVTHLLPQEHLQAGYVCERKDLLANGCCKVNIPGAKQYCCHGCWPNGCCSTFEYWTSCSLGPTSTLLECFPSRAAVAFQNLFMAVEEHFELFLAKCRTSSQSMQHENTYQDPVAKSCYGASPPELFPV